MAEDPESSIAYSPLSQRQAACQSPLGVLEKHEQFQQASFFKITLHKLHCVNTVHVYGNAYHYSKCAQIKHLPSEEILYIIQNVQNRHFQLVILPENLSTPFTLGAVQYAHYLLPKEL